MNKVITAILALIMSSIAMHARTLVAYYSYTNNVERIVTSLGSQIEVDVIEIEPAEKGLDYAANNYALGTQLLNKIRSNPTDASSYPSIDPVQVDMDEYDTVIIAVPLWWSQMAAPFQTFLFHYGPLMAEKNIGVIVSSASSGISGVVADAKRLIPQGHFLEPNLWICSSQTSNAATLLANWLRDIDYSTISAAVAQVSADGSVNGWPEILSEAGEGSTLSVYTLSGAKVMETSGAGISAPQITPGIYIAKVTDGQKSATRKITVGL